ncbi:phytoene desaturase family protein [Candidatus Hodarchaeum mangrovi]
MIHIQNHEKRVIVIGAGLGGLAAAIRMQALGYKVSILEKTDRLGGKASVFKKGNYIFDGGPTAVTAPYLIEELFSLNNEKMSNFLELKPVKPYFRIYFNDGSHFDYSTIEENIQQIKAIDSNDAEGYKKMIKSIEPIFQKGFMELSDKSFESFWSMLKIAPALLKLGAYKSVYSYVSKYIKSDKLRMVFSYHPLLIGGNPFKITAIYMLIQAVEKEWGVWFVRGGTGKLVEELAALFIRMGGNIQLNSEVKEVLFSTKKKVSGVILQNGKILNSNIVISNAPVATTYLKLIPKAKKTRIREFKYRHSIYSMSVFMIYFGTNRLYPDLHLHNIILGKRYKGLIDEIFNKKQLNQQGDFSAYLYVPSRIDRSLAPPEGETFYILVPVPNQDSNINWEEEKIPFRNLIMGFLEKNFLPNLSKHLATEKILTPKDFEERYLDYKGAVFSLAPTFTQSAFFRPHNRFEDFTGLYIVGAGTHPGGGIPGVFSSAKLTTDIISNLKK